MSELLRVSWYRTLQLITQVLCTVFFQIRVFDRRNIPLEGGVLLVSNHQSYLDPVLVGVGLRRRMNFLARESLFRFGPFGWLIRSLYTIPIAREGLGLSGVKETLRRLRRGEAVGLFPEGTRTRDGSLGPLRSGFYAIVSRAKVPLVPVRIEGAFQAWPRGATVPRMHPIRITYGRPLSSAEVRRLGEQAVLDWVRQQWETLDATRQSSSASLE